MDGACMMLLLCLSLSLFVSKTTHKYCGQILKKFSCWTAVEIRNTSVNFLQLICSIII